MVNKNISLDPESLIEFLNSIKKNIEQDREFALENYRTLLNRFNSGAGHEDSIVIHDLSESLERFSKLSSQATDKLIKIAKIVADVIKKGDDSESSLTDEEREKITDNVTNILKSSIGE